MRLLEGELIHGAKGGSGGGHTPSEQPDDLLSEAKLKMLLALSEGEIQGDLTAQQILLNGTPLAGANDEYNFTGVNWEYRTGSQAQDYIQGVPEINTDFSAGQEVKTDTPWIKEFTKQECDAIRIKLSLPVQYRYKDNGDMVGAVTEYAIDLSVDGGDWQNVVSGKFDGKTTSEYQRDHRINLPKPAQLWSIRVRRITEDSTSSRLVNAFKVYSYSEVVDSKLRYPNTALLYIEVDSKQFNGSVPKVSCLPKGKIVKVPSNYDTVNRTYSGAWDGAFVMGYTNNPAWIFYDLVLDPVHGMGARVTSEMVDKWELYAIAQYCDEMVSDGADGKEPRFTCNVYIQNQQDAYTVLKDIAAIFRGITFWGNDQIYVKADVPQDGVDYVYHASNVIDGLFTYAGGSYKNRYSSCLVSWSDPSDHYSDTTEGVYDSDLVSRYGFNQTQLTAIGCTSQSEAHRRGRWVLLSNSKDATVSFGVGLDGYIPLPAEIIGVADPFRAGKQNGGRVHSIDGHLITLDRPIDYAVGDRLVVNLPDGSAQTRTISAVSDDKLTVTVSTAFEPTPVPGAVWAIDSDTLAIQYYRVTSIKANDDGDGGFTISGVQHDPNKYRLIDDGVKIDPPPSTITPTGVVDAPKNITISEADFVEQGLSVSSMLVTWDKVANAINYEAQWRKDNSDWVNVAVTSAQGFSIQGIYSGVYDVRVRAVNAFETSSPWGYAESTQLNGKTGKPGTPENFLASSDIVWNINLTWGFPNGSGDTAYTEIQRSTTADYANPELLSLVPYPSVSYQHGPMPAGVRQWYRARLVDKIGNVGDWSPWVMGATSEDASDILGDITDDFMTTEDGEALLSQLNLDPNAIIQNALASHENVNQQWEQYAENKAGIIQAQTIAADANQAVAELETVIDAKFGDVEALIDDNKSAIATANSAISDIETNVVAQFGDMQAALQQKMDAYVDASGGSAIYTLKTGITYNNTHYDAGLSVAVTINGEQVDTRVAILANQFVIMSGSGSNVYSPFAVKNGQVFMNQAFIENGTVTNEKIGDYIQSSNFVSGSVGWHIGKDGSSEFSNAVVRGNITATQGHFSNCVIDASCTVERLYAENIYGDIISATGNIDTNWPSGGEVDSGVRYPIATITGAPFSRILVFLGESGFYSTWRENITVRVDENVVFTYDTGNDGTNKTYTNLVIPIPASNYNATHQITIQFPNRDGGGSMKFTGIMMLYKASGSITVH